MNAQDVWAELMGEDEMSSVPPPPQTEAVTSCTSFSAQPSDRTMSGGMFVIARSGNTKVRCKEYCPYHKYIALAAKKKFAIEDPGGTMDYACHRSWRG